MALPSASVSDGVVGSRLGPGRRYEDHLVPSTRAVFGIGYQHDERLAERLANCTGLSVAADHLDAGGLAGAGEEEIVAAAARQGQQRDVRARAGRSRGRRISVVLDLESVALDRRKAVGSGTQSIFTFPVYLEIVECGDASIGVFLMAPLELAVVAAGQFKLNLDLALGHPVARLVQHHHLDRRGDPLVSLGVRGLDPECRAGRAPSRHRPPPPPHCVAVALNATKPTPDTTAFRVLLPASPPGSSGRTAFTVPIGGAGAGVDAAPRRYLSPSLPAGWEPHFRPYPPGERPGDRAARYRPGR